MREVRKRLTVKNDGFCRSNTPAYKRIDKVINRYVAKMSAKGWIPSSRPSAGDNFMVYEAYIYMCHPIYKERTKRIEDALYAGWAFSDGVFHWPTN